MTIRRSNTTGKSLLLVSGIFASLLFMTGVAHAWSIMAVPGCTPGTNPIPPNNQNPVFLISLIGSNPPVELPSIPPEATNDPTYSAFNRKGELFVANRFNNDGVNGSISRFLVDSHGNCTPNGTITGTGLVNVHGLAFGPGGELFAANFSQGTISRFLFDADGNVIDNGTMALGGLLQGIAFDECGVMYVADYSSSVIRRFVFDLAGNPVETGSFKVQGDAWIDGLAFSPAGELFVAGGSTSQVFRYTFNCNGSAVAGSPISTPGGPVGVAFSKAGELFVSSHVIPNGIYRFLFDKNGVPRSNGIIPVNTSLGGISIFHDRGNR